MKNNMNRYFFIPALFLSFSLCSVQARIREDDALEAFVDYVFSGGPAHGTEDRAVDKENLKKLTQIEALKKVTDTHGATKADPYIAGPSTLWRGLSAGTRGLWHLTQQTPKIIFASLLLEGAYDIYNQGSMWGLVTTGTSWLSRAGSVLKYSFNSLDHLVGQYGTEGLCGPSKNIPLAGATILDYGFQAANKFSHMLGFGEPSHLSRCMANNSLAASWHVMSNLPLYLGAGFTLLGGAILKDLFGSVSVDPVNITVTIDPLTIDPLDVSQKKSAVKAPE